MQKKLILPVAALAAAGVLVFSATQAQAFGPGGRDTMVTELAQKLGIDQTKVQAAFDEMQKEHKLQMQTQFEARLDEAVNNGEITDAQKNAIVAKHAELQQKRETERESFQDMTPEERKAARDQGRTDLETWAKEQGIDIKYVFGSFGPGMHGGAFRGHGMMNQ